MLEQVATHWNATLFQPVYGSRLFTDWSVYFHISNCSWNCKPSGVCERGFSRTVKFWGNRDLTVLLPVITYIYLCGRIFASCLSYISNRPSRMGQKLNWNVAQALQNIYHRHFIMYRQLVLSPFSSNISCCRTYFLTYIYLLPIRRNTVYKLMWWLYTVRYNTMYYHDVLGISSIDVTSGALLV